ncbi:hypothetical protein MTO96_014380 [Rhipicephalus appendiculatus]
MFDGPRSGTSAPIEGQSKLGARTETRRRQPPCEAETETAALRQRKEVSSRPAFVRRRRHAFVRPEVPPEAPRAPPRRRKNASGAHLALEPPAATSKVIIGTARKRCQ